MVCRTNVLGGLNLIAYLVGNVEYIDENYVILENNNIGYKIFLSINSLKKLSINMKDVKIYTYLYLREDLMVLYGATSKEELNIFKLLTSVSGIGPKVALSIISAIDYTEIAFAIAMEDLNTLVSLPGIGKKTAQKIILELKDKMLPLISKSKSNIKDNSENRSNLKHEAMLALVSLGYSQNDVSKIMGDINESNDLQKMIKEGLVALSNKG